MASHFSHFCHCRWNFTPNTSGYSYAKVKYPRHQKALSDGILLILQSQHTLESSILSKRTCSVSKTHRSLLSHLPEKVPPENVTTFPQPAAQTYTDLQCCACCDLAALLCGVCGHRVAGEEGEIFCLACDNRFELEYSDIQAWTDTSVDLHTDSLVRNLRTFREYREAHETVQSDYRARRPIIVRY